VKKKDLIKRIESMGCVFVRHGSNHDWYKNPEKEKYQPIPRHNEIGESLAKRIIKKLS